MATVKRRNNFEQVKRGLEASRDGALEERARLKTIADAIAGLPEAVKPMAQRLMFTTRLSASEIVAAAKCASGDQSPSAVGDAQLQTYGRSTAQRLLGKVDDPFINFDPVSPNIRTFDLEGDLARAGAETAAALKKAGYGAPSGLGVMA
jgi:hypothetical protein